jgi:23S rRNA (cytosine1962-C5)-methyltransferase
MSELTLRLTKGGRHKVLHGHPWVFSNQLEELPKALAPGDPVVVVDSGGAFVGRGYGHPQTLISARLLERDESRPLDDEWLAQRLEAALSLRRRMGRAAFRWIFAEGDSLPGLVIDRFEGEGGPRVVLASSTAGTDRMLPRLKVLLKERFNVKSAVLKCDGRGRELEGLESYRRFAFGKEEKTFSTIDDGLLVSFDPVEGQKTGLFLDMWENRRRMVPFLNAGRVLDLFSYVGQWGLHAARSGADEVLCVDRSEAACAFVADNARRNGLEGKVSARASSVDAFLKRCKDESFDGVICDPPAFIPSKKHVAKGMRAYRSLFESAARKVRPGGFLVLASCSYHLHEERFAEVAYEACARAGRSPRVLVRGDQSPDHPVPFVFDEGRYLKCWLLQV